MFHRYYSTGFTTLIFKSEQHYKDCVAEYERLSGGKRKISAHDLDSYEGHVFDGVRYMNQTELERCQTVPEGYTKCLTRNEAADVLGDGWTVDVIAHILSYIKKEEKEKKEMELKMNEYQLPENILFNYEELKAELEERVSMYTNLVYTDEQIAEAKKDKANLNKLKKALNDERIRLQKEYMQPFDEFKKKIDEIISIIDKPVNLIDLQVKAFEDKQKQDKLNDIYELWDSIEHPEELPLKHVYQEHWLNKSTSMKVIEDCMKDEVVRFNRDMETLAKLPEFSFEAQQMYISCLDLNNALNEASRLSQMAKKKAEMEAEKARLAEEAKKMEGTVVRTIPEIPPLPITVSKQWVRFQAFITNEDALALREFFKSRNIEFKAC